jgi:hypothetical protein
MHTCTLILLIDLRITMLSIMNFRRSIQRFDLLRMVPDEFKESSILGLILSATFIALVFGLFVNQFIILFSDKVESQIFIDHPKDDKDLYVNIEILLHSYPCALLSLDKLDEVYTHTMDVQENLMKYSTDRSGNVIMEIKSNDGLNVDQRINIAKSQIMNKEGCLLAGNFTIKMVPGDFHISFHRYTREVEFLMTKENFQPDFSNTVKKLSFGKCDSDTQKRVTTDFGVQTLHSLESVDETNLIDKVGFPHGVFHQLNIVPSKFEYSDGLIHEVYQYSASTFTIAGGMLSIIFKFNIENVLMYYQKKAGSFSHFCIQCATILGGIYMLLTIIKLLLEDGVLNLIFKRRIGKLE